MKEAGKEEEKHINRLFTPVKRGKRVSERSHTGLILWAALPNAPWIPTRDALAPGRGLQKTEREMR
jgi:hypothetical protein